MTLISAWQIQSREKDATHERDWEPVSVVERDPATRERKYHYRTRAEAAATLEEFLTKPNFPGVMILQSLRELYEWRVVEFFLPESMIDRVARLKREGKWVDHKDGDPRNNDISNLEIKSGGNPK